MSSAAELQPDETVFRYIHPAFVKDGGAISSAAFTDEQLSVDRERLCLRPQPIKPGFGTSVLLVGDVNGVGFKAIADRTKDNPAHALIPGKKTKSQQRQLAAIAVWRCRPAPPA